MTALGAARGLTEIRPRSARDLQGPPQAKRARRRRNGVWGVPMHLRYSEDGTHSRHSKNRRPYSLSRFPSPFCIVFELPRFDGEMRPRFAGPAAGEKGPPQAKRGVGCPHLRYSEDSLILFPDSLRTRGCPIFARYLSAISLRYPTANSLLRTWCARVCACACGCMVVRKKPHGVQTSAGKLS